MTNATDDNGELHKRMAFLKLTASDLQVVAGLQPIIAHSIGPTLDIFYQTAKQHPEAAKFFSSDSHIEHAKQKQIKHWSHLLSGHLDGAYVASATTIGRTHAKLGLDPRWYIDGYGLILSGLVTGVLEAEMRGTLFGSRMKGAIPKISALIRATMLDMDFAISTYGEALSEERSKIAAERARIEEEQQQALSALDNALAELSNGNLTAQITTPLAPQYEALRGNFNKAVATLAGAFDEISHEAGQVNANTRELTRATDDMAKRTEQQAAALEETAAALEEISVIAKQSAQRSREAQTVASHAAEAAGKSGEIVGNAVAAMSAIEDSSTKISSIISVIDEISFQTNLLALNAGVEAARAGEAGKGFAVVAQEVRELAQRSANAAKEIKTLIDRSSKDVANGVALVNQTGDVLRTISDQVREVDGHIAAIAQAAQEQASGMNEINAAISSMDQLTQQNASMVEETNASTHTLQGVSDHLASLLARFQTQGTKAHTPRSGAYHQSYAA
ncbi:globin-coupled sensor protein [Agrobacterium vitis]|uniref:methyl-accepting chemotaxis protein n=1 Tax=Allorhizobium ampelinum TaxID=3025782 RepID=UPI001F2E740F|nr:methyl-accepting chemotaxis protein [Allorhizobium ampelinum]MCF1472800.1 globin-coupled sensor protein [Allorhizobium ampelinum]